MRRTAWSAGRYGRSSDAKRSLLPKVERNLDRTSFVLRRESGERVAPVVETEPVREHSREVDLPVGNEIEVVLDPVLANAAEVLESKGVRADHRNFLEVKRCVFPPGRAVHTRLHQRSARLQDAR